MPRRVALLLPQLAALLLVLREFHLLSPMALRLWLWSFPLSVAVVFAPAYRIPLFAVASLAAILQVLGLRAGLALLAIGGALIAFASAPMRPRARVLLLLAVGAFLALARGGVVSMGVRFSGLLSPIWPVLGSMFMFRLGLFVYDRHNNEALARQSIWHSLGYFFLLPNVCFPFFPVIDYVTFSRAARERRAEELLQISQQGIWLMLLGVSHLLLYRLVRNWMVLDPPQVTSPLLYARYLIAGYLLYLRISGEFHFIVGTLHLFGFELPYTHRNYFFAEGFGDLARRINVYWKDFMAKVVFYPSLHWLRRRGVGSRAAIFVTVPLVAAVTLLLHSYQWFWIRGATGIRSADILFWSVLTALVLVRLGTSRPATKTADGLSALRSAASTAATFAAMCILWSLWNSDSLGEWMAMTARAFGGGR